MAAFSFKHAGNWVAGAALLASVGGSVQPGPAFAARCKSAFGVDVTVRGTIKSLRDGGGKIFYKIASSQPCTVLDAVYDTRMRPKQPNCKPGSSFTGTGSVFKLDEDGPTLFAHEFSCR